MSVSSDKEEMFFPDEDPIIVTVAGLIGAGKSTLLRKLQATGAIQLGESYQVAIVLEPTDVWEAEGDLAAFYINQEDNALAFQMIVFDTHIEANEKVIKAHAAESKTRVSKKRLIIISERGIFDQMLFWMKQTESNLRCTQPIHRRCYQRIWQRFRHFIPEPKGIIYLKTDVDVAMERMENREREKMKDSMPQLVVVNEEANAVAKMDMQLYQKRLKEMHDEWFTTPMANPPYASSPISCLHIFVSDQPYHVHDGSLYQVAQQMTDFIKTLL